MVEIDEAVMRASRRYLPAICGAAFEDPRARVIVGDGIAYVRETTDRFDVVLVDSTDPEGPAVGLFAEEFYADVARRLTPDGVLAVQSGSAVYQLELVRTVRRHLRSSFPIIRSWLATVVTYPAVVWSFTMGSLSRDPVLVSSDEIARRVAGAALRYYTPSRHFAAFDLPPYLRREAESL